MTYRKATIQRGKPHPFAEDPDTPGCCTRCARIEANDVHTLPPLDAAVQEETARRLGERD